jgi:hypothetical protein
MPNVLKVEIGANPDEVIVTPDDLLNAGMYGAGAVVRVQSGATQTGSFANVGSAAIVSGIFAYTIYDQAGTATTWYRTRYENAGGSPSSDWSAAFQVLPVTPATTPYATLAGAKQRLDPNMGAQSDPLLQSLCDQVNGWIESKTDRILAPISAFATTLNGSVSAGASSAVLTSVIGLAVGDSLMLDLVTATPHESVTVLTIAGSTVTFSTALVSGYASGKVVKRVLIQDGRDAVENMRVLLYPRGIISITSLETAQYTGGAFLLVPAGDYKLRPTPPAPGWPFDEIHMTDIPSAGNSSPFFFRGYDNVRIDCLTGFPAIPDEIIDIGLTAVVGAWRSRASGGGDTFTIGADGQRSFERALSWEQKRTLARYTLKSVEII